MRKNWKDSISLLALLFAFVTAIMIGQQVWSGERDFGSLADWIAAFATFLAVVAAFHISGDERRGQAEDQSALEAAMVIIDVDLEPDTLDQAIGRRVGSWTVTGIVKPCGPTPIRNVRSRMTWSHGTVSVDRRGTADGSSGEYQCRHLDPSTPENVPSWPFTVTWDPSTGGQPTLDSWTVSWIDRWGQWWEMSLGADTATRIDPLEPVSPLWPS